MCGIIGVVGHKDVAPEIINGLAIGARMPQVLLHLLVHLNLKRAMVM